MCTEKKILEFYTHYFFVGNTGEVQINANQYLQVPICINLGPT